jgi:hypothetical protein
MGKNWVSEKNSGFFFGKNRIFWEKSDIQGKLWSLGRFFWQGFCRI